MRKFLLSSLLIFAALPFTFAQVITLGPYPATTIIANSNTTVIPAGTPSNAPKMTAFASTGFKGQLCVIPATGVVRITNAYPAGTYTITVRGFSGAVTASTSFLLQVNNPLCGTGLFNSGPNINLGTNLSAFAIGDFNQSGKQDIAATNANNINNVSFGLNNGAGAFSSPANIGVGVNPKSIALADFNGDGKIDFATGNSNNTVSVRLGFGANGFTTAPDVAIGSGANSIAVADFNGDGKPDFATGNFSSNTVSIRLGNGAGGFTGTTDISVGTNPTAIAIGDFNADGNPDFVTTNFLSYTASVRLGDGLGGFSGSTELSVQTFPVSVEVADVNADGKQDIIVANQGGGVSVLLGNGAGAFGSATYVSVGTSPRALTTGDFNGDGQTDIATANAGNGSPTISIRLGDGTGGFSGTTELPISSNPGKLLTGDFNSDGRQDLIALHDNGNTISLRLGSDKEINVKGNNTSIADGDGTPSFADHTDFGNVGSTLIRSFIIQNTGTANLIVNNITISGTDSALFTRGGIPLPIMIGAGRDTFFTVTFSPTSTGLKAAMVKILSDDCDEAVYDFAIQGNGVAASLGTYPATTITTAGGNAAVTPSAAPSGATNITANTSAGFKGTLQINPLTGVVTITNAHPAGTYSVTVKAFNGIAAATTTFPLTVGNTLCSQGLLSGYTFIDLPGGPVSVAIADFNNDGKQDIAAANGSISIRLGDGTGNFTGTTNVPVGNNPFSVATGDFNNDGKPDLATANFNDNTVSIRLGNGAGGFSGNTEISTPTGPYSVAIADFNGDGRADFITANYNSNNVAVRLNNGAGGFGGAVTIAVGNHPQAVAIGDFNNDGKWDFATANNGSGNLTVGLGDGTGGFTGATTIVTGGAPYHIVIGDFNGDGKQDLAAANPAYGVTLNLGNGAGGFGATTYTTVSDGPRAVATGDFNGDGQLDIATGNYSSSTVSTLLGNGAGGFTVLFSDVMGSYPSSIAIGDFNGDGRQDVATGNMYGPYVAIRIGETNEINVRGNNVSIADGDVTPSATDATDFGNAGRATRTFTIQNTGQVKLKIASINISGADSSMFTWSGITLPATIPPGGAASITVTFLPTSTGLKTTTVNITNDDCDEALYNFTIQATGVPPAVGTYIATTVIAGGNTAIIPSATITYAQQATAFTSPEFKGLLQVDSLTGVLRITNARPAGTYTIRVSVFNGIATVTTSFLLTVNIPACSQGLFRPYTVVNAGYQPFSTAIGDFNGDGLQDMATLNAGDDQVFICSGNGAGGFGTFNNVTVGDGPLAISIADFNGDGRQDLVTANNNSNTASVRFGNGAGSFSGSVELATGTKPVAIEAGDFNGDSRADFVVLNNDSKTITAWLGNGAGGFTAGSTTQLANIPANLTTSDFNADGITDIAISISATNSVLVLLGNGTGGFTLTSATPAGTTPSSLKTADFNGDGKPDLIVANYNSNDVTVCLGNGSGGFAGTTIVAVGSNPQAVETGDFNGDGKTDFAVTSSNANGSSVHVKLGNGAGGFTSTNTLFMGVTPNRIATADFNGDGITDLATTDGQIYISLGGANEINVQGNTVNIATGSTLPATSNNTDFGSTATNQIRSFVIQNTGSVNLTVSDIQFSGTDASLFAISNISAFPFIIAPGASAGFDVAFVPTTTGLKTTTVNIINTDCDEPVYNFTIQGAGQSTTSPSLGNYPATTIIGAAGGNIIVTPSTAPVNAVMITAIASAGFKGQVAVNPVTGVVNIINAHPAGNYTITVKVNGVATAATSFGIIVSKNNCSQAQFTQGATIAIGTTPVAIAVGDFNGDGKQDIVTSNSGGNTVSIRLGDGTGGFTGTTNVGVGVTPRSIAVADFNGDGKPDIATANQNNSVSIRLGDGAGGFNGTTDITVAAFPRSIAVADFNSDGKPDIATANFNDGNVSIRYGNGAGSVNGSTNIATGSGPMWVVAADFNNDGKADFAVANNLSNTVSVCLGNGSGGFSNVTHINVVASPLSIVAADFNGDGKPDLAIACNNAIFIRLGDGSGYFTGTNSFFATSFPRSIVAGDFNGDGKEDVITANYLSSGASLRLGDGKGGFGSMYGIAMSDPLALVTGDFNNDGIQDIAAANYAANTFSTRLGNPDQAEINVTGNTINIPDGNSTIDTADFTNMGTIIAGTTIAKNFTIQNTGTGTLTINSIGITGTDSLLFSSSGLTLPATIAANTSKTFTLTFKSYGVAGTKNAGVSIYNDDCDEATYQFAVQGNTIVCASMPDNTWLGITNNWNQAGNWSLGIVPTACTKVIVNGGVPFMPQVTDAASICYSLTLMNGAIITVKTGSRLNIVANN